jgi:lipopolysaccharide export LptBFGC system permease protein LptF
MLHVLFILAVVVGFIMWFLATWPVPYGERIARACFAVAAVIWAIDAFGGAGK